MCDVSLHSRLYGCMPLGMSPGGESAFSRLRSAAASVAGAVASAALLIFVAVSFMPEGAIRSVIENLAAIVFGIGVIQILFEAYLHSHVSAEVMGQVDTAITRVDETVASRLRDLESTIVLDRSLVPTGLKKLQRTPVDWTGFVAGSTVIAFVPSTLSSWSQQEWLGIIERARSSKIEVDLYLPNPETTFAESFEVRLAIDSFQTVATEALTEAQDAWRQSAQVSGSILRIHTYDRPVGLGLLLSDSRWALTAAPICGPRPGAAPIVALADDGSDTGYRVWLEEQIGFLGAQQFDELVVP